MTEPAPDPLRAPPGVWLTIWTITLTALPVLWLASLYENPPREFSIVMLAAVIPLWAVNVGVAVAAITTAPRRYQRIIGIVGVVVPAVSLVTVLAVTF